MNELQKQAQKELDELLISHAETGRDRELDYPDIKEEEEIGLLEQIIDGCEESIASTRGRKTIEILYVNNEPFSVQREVIEKVKNKEFVEFDALKGLVNGVYEWTRFYYSPFTADNPNKITLEKSKSHE